MLRRSMMTMLVLAGTLTACQTETGLPEAELAQELTTHYCEATMPPIGTWDGKAQLPQTTASSTYILYASQNGKGLAVLVDYGTGQIPFATWVVDSLRGPFAAQGAYGRIVIPGDPPPPPDITGPGFMASALRYSDVPKLVAADLNACE